MIRAGRIDSRNVVASNSVVKDKQFPAPIKGWASNASIALDNPGFAEVMENFIPTQTGIRVRGGQRLAATVSSLAVTRLINYNGTTTKKLFAASNNSIFDITSVASTSTPPTAAVTGLTSTEISYITLSNAGGDFLLAFNGADLHRTYDGATWAANTPAITFTGQPALTSSSITTASVHNNRIWMVQKNSKTAWYLPLDSIAGAASDFAVEFRRGGKLLFIATWSSDSGSGSSDRIAFFSDEGEVSVFSGLYPGDASWQKFGLYDLPTPLGKYAFDKVGGDLLVATVNGIVPMSEVIAKDPAALSLSAITRNIEPDWKNEVSFNGTRPWSFQKWTEKNIGFVSIPSPTQLRTTSAVWGTAVWGQDYWGTSPTVEEPIGQTKCYVVNLLTGSWAKITGWDVRCMTVFDGKFYFGSSNGKVYIGDESGNDAGKSYECRLAYWPSNFGHVGHKVYSQCEGVFVNSTPISPKFSISVNNELNWPVAPGSPGESATAVKWDTGAKWDSGVKWDAKGTKIVTTRKWNSLGRAGRVGAPMLQMTFNTSTTPDIEFTDLTATFTTGAVVVAA